MTPRDLRRLLRLMSDMAAVIDRHQRVMKPREADKARQARQFVKKLTKNITNHEQVLRSEGAPGTHP